MVPDEAPPTTFESCRHDRAPLRRLGRIIHERTGRKVYVLLCTECGFTVTTDDLRRLRGMGGPRRSEAAGSGKGGPGMTRGHVPFWAPLLP